MWKFTINNGCTWKFIEHFIVWMDFHIHCFRVFRLNSFSVCRNIMDLDWWSAVLLFKLFLLKISKISNQFSCLISQKVPPQNSFHKLFH
jgi:hypothetical protein